MHYGVMTLRTVAESSLEVPDPEALGFPSLPVLHVHLYLLLPTWAETGRWGAASLKPVGTVMGS